MSAVEASLKPKPSASPPCHRRTSFDFQNSLFLRFMLEFFYLDFDFRFFIFQVIINYFTIKVFD